MGMKVIDLRPPPACLKSSRLKFSFTKNSLFSQIKQNSIKLAIKLRIDLFIALKEVFYRQRRKFVDQNPASCATQTALLHSMQLLLCAGDIELNHGPNSNNTQSHN